MTHRSFSAADHLPELLTVAAAQHWLPVGHHHTGLGLGPESVGESKGDVTGWVCERENKIKDRRE